MLTDEEKAFLVYWEANRLKERKWTRQLMVGLPIGLIFGLPILLNFMSGWYKRADMIRNAQFNPAVLVVAIVIISVFVALFYKRHKWDMHEQKYEELKQQNETETDNP